MANNKATQVVTGEVRISYEHLLKPYANQPNQEPKYSATLLIPKSDIATKQRIDAAIQAAIQEGVSSKWGGVRPAQPKVPLYDGDGVRPNGEAFGPECKGCWVMTASSKQMQEIVDSNRNPVIDSTQIYSGMYAKIALNFFPYFNSGNKGIGCGLGPVMKTRDGEPLGGRMTAADAFGDEPMTAYIPPVASYPQQQQPQYQQPQQAPYQQPQPQIDPITGQPTGGIYGI